MVVKLADHVVEVFMHLVMNFVYLRSYMLKLFAFCLDSCIVNKGEKFVLGAFERCSNWFGQL
jgi:hypothetical protein